MGIRVPRGGEGGSSDSAHSVQTISKGARRASVKRGDDRHPSPALGLLAVVQATVLIDRT